MSLMVSPLQGIEHGVVIKDGIITGIFKEWLIPVKNVHTLYKEEGKHLDRNSIIVINDIKIVFVLGVNDDIFISTWNELWDVVYETFAMEGSNI